MLKKYVVRLTETEREVLRKTVDQLKGGSEKGRRARILLKADADGPNWTDADIADALDCRTKTVENIRQRFVTEGFETALHGKKRAVPPVARSIDGDAEARIIATRLGSPPSGYSKWTLRLLARKVVELAIVDRVSHETVRAVLKKTT